MWSRFGLRIWFVTLLLSIGCLYSLTSASAQSTRYALVIGNGDYFELSKLKNPVNDANDIATTLKSLGFELEILTNANLASMEEAVVRLGNKLSTSRDCIGFYFYAGHAVQLNGINYLIPADAHIISESYLKTRTLSLQDVLDIFKESRNTLNIVVLDACRDNPFSWARSGSRGLSVVSTQPPGSIIAYATSAGSVARDGTGRNGVFTAELLKVIHIPGLEIIDVFKRTGAAVQAVTQGLQVPAIYSQFFENVVLSSLGDDPNITTVPPKVPTLKKEIVYGSVILASKSTGILYLDGIVFGHLAAGSTVRLDDIPTGQVKMEMHYTDGNTEIKTVEVKGNATTMVSFAYMVQADVRKTAESSVVLLDAPVGGGYYGMYGGGGTAACFSLSQIMYISSIDVVIRTPGNASISTFHFNLQNSLTDPITIIASEVIEAPLGKMSTLAIKVDRNLQAGKYYLVGTIPGYVGTVTPGDVNGWLLSSGKYTGTGGNVEDGVWSGSNSRWNLLKGDYNQNGTIYYAPAFSVKGRPVSP